MSLNSSPSILISVHIVQAKLRLFLKDLEERHQSVKCKQYFDYFV